MKAADRCPSHHQGDRCKGVRGHSIEGELFHVGNFSSWDDDKSVELYPRIYRRDRAVAREKRNRETWIKNTTLMIRLGALASLYVRSFMKKPEEKKDVIPAPNVPVPSKS